MEDNASSVRVDDVTEVVSNPGINTGGNKSLRLNTIKGIHMLDVRWCYVVEEKDGGSRGGFLGLFGA